MPSRWKVKLRNPRRPLEVPPHLVTSFRVQLCSKTKQMCEFIPVRMNMNMRTRLIRILVLHIFNPKKRLSFCLAIRINRKLR